MANFKEEQTRNSRRLARQILGAVALLLAFIGLLTVVGWGVSGVRTLLDDTELRNEYADDLYGMVMLDPVTFDDVSTVDPSVFKQAAIWGTVYQAQKDGLGLEQYERDADTGSVMLPKLEIDTYIANLLGADYAQTVPAGSFETPEFIYQYNEEKQCYLVPVTGSVAQYTPLVEKIKTSGRQRIVTVGYVPTAFNNDNGELSLTAPTEPTKYMDYVFTPQRQAPVVPDRAEGKRDEGRRHADPDPDPHDRTRCAGHAGKPDERLVRPCGGGRHRPGGHRRSRRGSP